MPSIEFDLPKPSTVVDYLELDEVLRDYLARGLNSVWADAMRWLIVNDLYFLMSRVMTSCDATHEATGKKIFHRTFILNRCRELEQFEHNKPVVWGRGMGKSSLRTKGRNLQRALADPESGGCIFSYQKTAAQKHLRAIKEELENNTLLKKLFDEILWWNPKNEARTWSLELGLSVKRKTARTEQTFEAHAFMFGLPTGSHYNRIDWDDVEDDKSVSTPEMLDNLHKTFAQSANLKTRAGKFVRAPTGTFYHSAGLMAKLVREAGDHASLWPGEDLSRPGDGPMGGTPIYYSTEELWEWWEEIADPNVYAMQVACDYKAGSGMRLHSDSLVEYDLDPLEFGRNCYIYICVDPSMGVGDPTVAWVWGTTPDRKFAWLDGFRAKLRPSDRNEWLLNICQKWDRVGAGLQQIRIEEFGQADYVDSTRKHFEKASWTPSIVKCSDVTKGKVERIYSRWEQPLRERRILVPRRMAWRNENGEAFEPVSYFSAFELGEMPKPATDDMLDAGSLMWEPEDKVGPIAFPPSFDPAATDDYGSEDSDGTFMSAGVL